MTTLPNPQEDLVAATAARFEAAEDATDGERLRVLDELYADLEAELEREIFLPHSQDFEQTGPAGR